MIWIHLLSSLDGCEAHLSPTELYCGHLQPVSPHGYYFSQLTFLKMTALQNLLSPSGLVELSTTSPSQILWLLLAQTFHYPVNYDLSQGIVFPSTSYISGHRFITDFKLLVWQLTTCTCTGCHQSTFDTKNPHVLAQRKDGHRGKCSALLTFTAVSHNLCIVDCYIWDKHLMLDVLVYSEANKKRHKIKRQKKKKDIKQPKSCPGFNNLYY